MSLNRRIDVRIGEEEMEMLHYLLVRLGVNSSAAARAGIKMLYESEKKKEEKEAKSPKKVGKSPLLKPKSGRKK